MRWAWLAFSLLLTFGVALSQNSANWQSGDKLILVTTPEWNTTAGSLVRYERKGNRWRQVGLSIPVVVGRSGSGWDPKLARAHPDLYSGPVKHEGDGRSPAGLFELNRGAFGYAPSLSKSSHYFSLTPTTECVDDSASRYYGQIVDRTRIRDVDWNSSEKMRSIPQYQWGIVVNYNMERPTAGDGSCIFLHQWSAPRDTTAGCTAMAPEKIETLVHWVEGRRRSVLVQLPQAEYQRLRQSWRLP